MTYPPEHNPQLVAYLQAWRQVLEPLTPGITAAMPFPGAPWGMPPMPPFTAPMPTAPPPPMPADYTQQLFGYLQAWRQYLEQATGARPAEAQRAGAQPTDMQASDTPGAGGSAQTARPEGSPTVTVRPDNPIGGRATETSPGNSPTPDLPPKVVLNRPNEGGTQSYGNDRFRRDDLRRIQPDRQDRSIQVNPDRFGQAAARARGTLMGMPPGVEFGSPIGDPRRLHRAAEGPEQRPASSPAGAGARPAVPGAQVRAGSLFPGLAERAAARIQRDVS